MKLNLGCSGPAAQMRGYLNCDIIQYDGVDRIIDITSKLPFPDSSIEEIQCHHVLEHILFNQVEFALSEMYRVLIPGSLAYISLPNWDWLENAIKSDLYSEEQNPKWHIMCVIYGQPFGEHRYCWAYKEFIDVCKKVGFSDIQNYDRGKIGEISIICRKTKHDTY